MALYNFVFLNGKFNRFPDGCKGQVLCIPVERCGSAVYLHLGPLYIRNWTIFVQIRFTRLIRTHVCGFAEDTHMFLTEMKVLKNVKRLLEPFSHDKEIMKVL